REVRLRIARANFAKGCGKIALQEIRGHAEPDALARGGAAHRCDSLLVERDDLARMRNQRRAALGRADHPSARAFEHGMADQALEAGDLQADCRLRPSQPFRSARKALEV